VQRIGRELQMDRLPGRHDRIATRQTQHAGRAAAVNYNAVHQYQQHHHAVNYRDAAAMGYSNYYQQCAASMPQHMQHMATAHIMSPSAASMSASALAAAAQVAAGVMGPRSPVASPQPQQQSQMVSVGGAGGGPPGPGGTPHYSLQSQTSASQLTPLHDGGMSSGCSDDEDEGSPGSNSHMPVVYPWMKKIHIAGAGRKACIRCRRHSLLLLVSASCSDVACICPPPSRSRCQIRLLTEQPRKSFR